jgi:hypothetical protein
VPIAGGEEFKAKVAAATPAGRLLPARLAVEPAVAGVPMRLVPKEDIGAEVDPGVDPAVQEGSQLRTVEAGGADPGAVGEDLAGSHLPGDELAERLAAEDAGDAPRIEVDLETRVVGGGDDPAHRLVGVEQVVFGEAVDHVVEPARRDLLQVAPDVAEGAIAEVGHAGLDRHRLKPPVVTNDGTR